MTAPAGTGGPGLSHAEAMSAAEELQKAAKTVRVMHTFGGKGYEVDRLSAAINRADVVP